MRVTVALAATLATMRAATLVAPATLSPALAQVGGGVGVGPKVGELEVKAYQKIPKTKTAVQLTSDTALAHKLRREVMVRLSRRGNEVGFSGGNVMRMDVTYFDLNGGGSGSDGRTIVPGGQTFDGPGSNPRPDLPGIRLERRDGTVRPATGPTLRITLTLYAVDTGKVLWAATASCNTTSNLAEQAGNAMIDNIFTDADKNHIADAGCPL